MPASGAIGVMGGTFDPIHFGHLLAASEVADRLQLATVVFVPAGRPWQKDDREIASGADRLAMTAIAVADDPRFRVSDVDVTRPGPTYTVDTLRDLHQEYGPDAELVFITGADALAEVATWHEPDEIVALAHLVGTSRAGRPAPQPELPADRVTLMDIPAVDISASDIRQRVAAGRSIRYLVPTGVASYIDRHGLYRAAA